VKRAWIAMLFVATAAFANELTVDHHTARMNDSVTMIVTLSFIRAVW